MIDIVDDTEELYRCVFYDPEKKHWTKDAMGNVVVASSAFMDRNNQPSVDRAKLCVHDPAHTQKDPRDGVVLLVAGEIRSIGNIIAHAAPPIHYEIDVIYVPLPNNIAHAEVRANPAIAKDNVFRRLRASLAYLVIVRK